MAANDPYFPDFVPLADTESATFDGSAGATDQAIINEMYGNCDVNIFIERSNDGGTNWTQIAQLEDDAGNQTFNADWHSQFNRIMVKVGVARVKITATTAGDVAVSGDER